MPVGARAVLGNLPVELTSFVDRRRELGDVKRLLAQARLVTLSGVGGTGKTRLALRVAGRVRRAFPDGVWFVDLTELRDAGPLAGDAEDPEALAYLVVAALGLHDRAGVPPVRRLTDHLADRQTLLVLDNCEHLLSACAVLVDRVLRACPRLRIVATSREPLAVTGDVIFPVSPLPAPPPGDLRGLDRFDSVALFAARARAVAPGFELTDGNRAAVAEICRRLDGLPLAIELAAARIRVLAPQQILDRLTDRLGLPGTGSRSAPARQRTLRACMDWSFELCSEPERILWARLSVFVGGFELDAAEGICADESLPAEDLMDVVAGLVDKSVVVRDDDGHDERARFRMLETIRDFGQDRLAEAGEVDTLRRRHAAWYRQLVAQAKALWIGVRQEYWLTRLTREHPNLHAALEYSLTEPDRAETALHLVVTLPGLYWWTRGRIGEGRRWLDMTLTVAAAPTALRARALLLDSYHATMQGDGDDGLRLLDEGESLARRLGATVELALAAFVRGIGLLYRGDVRAAIEALESTQSILPALRQAESGLELEVRLGRLIALGMAAGQTGDQHRADTCFRELLAITERKGERLYRSQALWVRALSAWHQGEVGETAALLEAQLRLKRAPGSTDRHGTARCIEAMAWVAARLREHQRAAGLLGAAHRVWTEIGTPVTTFGYLIGHHEECVRQARAGLGDKAFTDAFTHGQALSYADAIAYALGERRQPASPASPGSSTPLTRREREVAGLVAEGLSNREIAGKLVISQRTAESHVEHILTKLGFAGRAQVAAWTAAQQPRDQD